MKKVIVLGATNNEDRVAFEAAHELVQYGYDMIPVGVRKAEVAGKIIINNKEILDDIDTISMYIGPKIQVEWYDYILKTKPKRIIFNPGTENAELEALANNQGIETEQACTLVLLKTKQF